MPELFAAWLAGAVDRPRVCVFERYLAGLAPEQVTAICRVAVPRAPALTTGRLAVMLRRMVLAVDPEAAARWYRKGVRERNVVAMMGPDGTVTMTASGLPADEAEAACERVQDLAVAAKRAGHPGLIGQIRCDLFLGLLDGRFHGMDEAQVLAALIARYRPDGPGSAAAPGARAGIEVRVALSTLLGRDEQPGEIPGLGLLPAPDARARVAQQRRAEWRFAVTDAEGLLLSEGVTRRRPAAVAGHPVRRDGPPGGIVEIHVPLALLHELVASDPAVSGEWAAVIADIAAQHASRRTHRADLDARPGARYSGAALRRHTEIRDQTCSFPGCRRRARAAELDHTRDHAAGGATTTANTGPLCDHDHDVKHRGGWLLTQPEPGTFVWHSPLGGEYTTRGEFLLPPMPEPHPVDLGPHFDQSTNTVDGPIMQPYRPLRGPRPPPPGQVLPDGPPF